MDFSKYFEQGWYEVLKEYLESNEFLQIAKNIAKDRKRYIIYPPQNSDLLFKVFRIVPYNEVKVIILGQDPYHGEDQYDGLAFSNSTLNKAQPSLANILEEVENDIYDGFNLDRVSNLSLYGWAEQGILLTNTAHTVIKGQPSSHLLYWKNFTLNVVEALNKRDDIIWLLWGRHAQNFKQYIKNPTHKIIETSHPSPLGCFKEAPIPFVDSKCFSKTNQYLKELGKKQIIW